MTFNPQFTTTPRMVRQIVAVERTNGFLNAVRLRHDWIGTLRRQVQVEDALASVQIEGSSLTLERAFELADGMAEDAERQLSDTEREFVNYLKSFEAIDDLHNDREAVLRKGDLLNLQQLLVDGVRGSSRMAGEFRREDVAVGDLIDGEKTVHHQPPPWTTVENYVEELLAWIQAAKTKNAAGGLDDPWLHPAIIAGICHHRLVWIHPFLDGNGRSSRMFTTLILYQRGYDFKYLFNLSEYYNLSRDRYYDALRTADRTQDYTGWLEYFMGGLANQMVRIEERAKKCSVESEE
jgi:Fic family protein